jgi:predicted RNA methylase
MFMTSLSRRSLREGVRPDIQSLVPVSSARILDLGCSSGHLGAALKARQSAYVVGIEADSAYASQASEVLDQAVHADFEPWPGYAQSPTLT